MTSNAGARWYGEVEGDLRPGGEFRARVFASGSRFGRVDACEPARRLLLTMRDAVQIHVEDLAAHPAGRERCDADARWDELLPAYQDLAANVG